ncbi:MAG TPA: hypothetical protein VL860_15115 [Planctomycetota bacterium]|nr:hypothetical protein [Planctomycetota bacterium]
MSNLCTGKFERRALSGWRRLGLIVATVGLFGRELAAADAVVPGNAAPVPTAAVPAAAHVNPAEPAEAPMALAGLATVVRDGLDAARVGDWVEYQVGVPPAGGVENRAAYRIHYEVLVLRTNEATLARTTGTLEGRTLAREVYVVKRYPRLAAARPRGAEKTPTAPATTAVSFTVAGKALDCLTVADTVRENGLLKKLEWALCREVPITGLVYEKVNGANALALIGFGRGEEKAAAAVEPAASVAVPTSAPAPQPAAVPVPAGGATVEPIEIVPVLPEQDLPLEDDPAGEVRKPAP